jgi:hypothetical protein
LKVEEEIGGPERDAVDEDHSALHVVPTQEFLLFDVGPLLASALLVEFYAVAKVFVPNSRCCHVYGRIRKTECQSLGVFAFSGTLSASYQNYTFHSSL